MEIAFSNQIYAHLTHLQIKQKTSLRASRDIIQGAPLHTDSFKTAYSRYLGHSFLKLILVNKGVIAHSEFFKYNIVTKYADSVWPTMACLHENFGRFSCLIDSHAHDSLLIANKTSAGRNNTITWIKRYCQLKNGYLTSPR